MPTSPGRNDKCPCGSGRKYKQCCQPKTTRQPADPGPQAPGPDPAAHRLVFEHAARETVWEVDAIPLAIGITDGAAHRPAAVLLMAGEWVIGSQIRDRLSGEADSVAAAFERTIVAAAQEVGSYPEQVTIRYPEIEGPLQSRLAPRGVEVKVAPVLEHAQPAAKELIEHMGGPLHWPPVSIADAWSAWRLPAAAVRDLFAAAADFWRRKPWKVLDDLQAPIATFPSGRSWTAGVLGRAAEEFGIVLYSDPDDLYAIATFTDSDSAMGEIRGRVISLTFNSVSSLPDAMGVEARTSGWEIADPEAFPILLTINTPGGGVTRRDIEELTAILLAVPVFAETHAEDLLLEQRFGTPAPLLEWRDEATGLRLQYDGDEAEDRSLAAAMANDPAFEEWVDEDEDSPQRELFQLAHDAFEELGPDADPEQIMDRIIERGTGVMGRLGEMPIPAFAGLSSRQLADLMSADWRDQAGAISLERTLSLDRLSDSYLLADCRSLLGYALEREGIPATHAGNLAVADVRYLLEHHFQRDHGASYLLETRKTIREEDVWHLHSARVLLEIAGALKRRKGRFTVTREGKRLMREENSGELFALLFRTHFKDFNLGYRRRTEWFELQAQIPFTLYRLSVMEPQWRTAEELLPEVVVPFAMDSAPASEPFDLPVFTLESQVLSTLAAFGLLQRKEPETASEYAAFHATALLKSFLKFNVRGQS